MGPQAHKALEASFLASSATTHHALAAFQSPCCAVLVFPEEPELRSRETK